ncbi:MAG: transglycosylase SLT domain-containing protein [Nitrospinae bacterium]|nr:transglycosylase SLT domain-containing protein [Nitrospinota bacterium]
MKSRACTVAVFGVFLLPAIVSSAPKERPAPATKPPLENKAVRTALPARIEKLLAKERYEELIRLLRRGKTDLGGRRSFLLGHAHLKLEQYRPAVKAFQKALERIPALENYSLLFLAKAALGAKDNGIARHALERLIKKGKKAPEPPFVYKELIQIHREEKRPLRAAKIAKRYLLLFPKSYEAPDFLLRRAKALRAARKNRGAALAFRELWRRHPEHPSARRALRRSLGIGGALSPSLKKPGPRDHYERARLLRKRYHFEKALRGLRDLKRRFPKFYSHTHYHKGIVFNEALALFSLRKTKQADPALRHAIRHYAAGSARRAEARYFLARNHLRKGNQPAFEKQAHRLLKESQKGKWAAKTRYLLARVYEDDRNFKKSARYYKKVIAKHPRSTLAPKALFQLAWIRFQSRDFRGALKAFSRMKAKYPDHWLVSSALYWAGVSAERTGERKSALAQYRACAREHRHRYYGQLALRAITRLAREGDPGMTKPPSLGKAGYREWLRLPPKSARVREMAALLSSMGFHELAAKEYRRLGSSPYSRYHAARAFTEAGQSHRAIYLINESFWDAVRAGGSDLPREFWEIVYPLLVKRKEPGGADPYLVNAVIRAESSFDPRAFSPAGAMGLMQLMPSTGRRLARKHEVRIKSVSDLFDPVINTRLGARHLGALIREFDGALVPAIASYNAGRRPVKRWWEAGRNKPIEIFIEEIPYQETKNYVKRVLGYYHEYKRIYGEANRSKRGGTPPS